MPGTAGRDAARLHATGQPLGALPSSGCPEARWRGRQPCGAAAQLGENDTMPRWLLGGALVIYLAGLFGFGLSRHFAQAEQDVMAAMAYGAGWPGHILQALGLF